MFPIKLWSFYELVIIGKPRTNNLVEGWHKALEQSAGKHNHTKVSKDLEILYGHKLS